MAPCALLLANRHLCMELNPFQPAGTSKHEIGNGETTTVSKRAGRYLHLLTSSQCAPVPTYLLAEVVETPLMPFQEPGASVEVVHVELPNPLRNENRSCLEHGACGSAGGDAGH